MIEYDETRSCRLSVVKSDQHRLDGTLYDLDRETIGGSGLAAELVELQDRNACDASRKRSLGMVLKISMQDERGHLCAVNATMERNVFSEDVDGMYVYTTSQVIVVGDWKAVQDPDERGALVRFTKTACHGYRGVVVIFAIEGSKRLRSDRHDLFR